MERKIDLGELSRSTEWIKVDCLGARGGRALNVQKLISEHGPAMTLWDLLPALSRECQRRHGAHECHIRYIDLARTLKALGAVYA